MFGLPLHPLVVHAAVVLVPLSFVGLVVAFAAGRWRAPILASAAALAVAGAFFAVLAAQSGEELEEEVEERAEAAGVDARFHDHPELGDQAEILAIVFAIVTVIAAGLPYAWKQAADRRAQLALMGIAAVVGAGATWWMVQAGHTGAELVWEETGNFVTGQQDGGGNGDADEGEREEDEDDDD